MGMIVAWSGIARPMRNSEFVRRRNLPEPPRTIAKAAMKEKTTAGATAPTVTMTLFTKYWTKSDWMTST
ncbi:hypothetical protein [Thermocatellispora tengchongensis]|uniref:hypothetical protein n=1 Tax=Thermocatellispora tengchongensis TaxID=1073253 RepID=UPI00363CDE5E